MNETERQEFERVEQAMRAPGAIMVFGANKAGKHGKGAAVTAYLCYGAVRGVGEGIRGRSYAIPTKDERIRTLPLSMIAEHVRRFLAYAASRPDLTFVVTRVGCGLAGYTDADMAPLFAGAPPNCALPPAWKVLAPARRDA